MIDEANVKEGKCIKIRGSGRKMAKVKKERREKEKREKMNKRGNKKLRKSLVRFD